MASLFGYNGKVNHNIAGNLTIDKDYKLIFKDFNEDSINEWLRMRQSIYTMIIGHPECVPYNAFLNKLLTLAIDSKCSNPK